MSVDTLCYPCSTLEGLIGATNSFIKKPLFMLILPLSSITCPYLSQKPSSHQRVFKRVHPQAFLPPQPLSPILSAPKITIEAPFLEVTRSARLVIPPPFCACFRAHHFMRECLKESMRRPFCFLQPLSPVS